MQKPTNRSSNGMSPLNNYHYNPIKLIWTQVKLYIAERNNSFKVDDVERMTLEDVAPFFLMHGKIM